MLTSKAFFKIKFILIFFIFLNFFIPNQIFAAKKRSIISGVEVKVNKKERKHVDTSALLCALTLNGNSLEDIKKSLEINFQKPISQSDHILIAGIMESMCPEFDNRKIFEN